MRLPRPSLALLALTLFLTPTTRAAAGDAPLALVGGTVLASPDAPPLPDAVVVVRDGRIAALGHRGAVAIPSGAVRIDCDGLFVTAAFQNSHVHFTEDKWVGAADLPAARLEAQLEEMFGQHGFTTVFDLASFAENTLALRERIESGELRGPRILTAGYALYPAQGIPYYLRDSMTPADLERLRTPATAAAASAAVRANLDAGADALKIFAVSWMGRGATQPMDVEIARAAVAAAHERGKPVFAHPSNTQGLEIALAAGVDILAHAVEDRRGWKPELTNAMLERGMALVPTLMLFDRDRFQWEILDGVGEFVRRGGQILFGTDFGFLPVYDPKDEYVWMSAAGMSPVQIFASLTTAPAGRFGESARRGRIAVGMDADLVVLGADPRNSVLALTQVKTTIRAGRVLYDGEIPR
jgi:imidazolonepropionase-like amidohydrolase